VAAAQRLCAPPSIIIDLDTKQGVIGVAQQRVNVVRALRGVFLLVVALMAVVSLVAMHSVAASAAADSNTGVSSSAPHTDTATHDLDSPNAEVCPCSSGSDPSMVAAECSTSVALSGPTVVASLRAQCAELAPLSPLASQRTGTVAQPTTPSLHVLSISRT